MIDMIICGLVCYATDMKVKLARKVDGEKDRYDEMCMYLYLDDGCRHVDNQLRPRNAKLLIDVGNRQPRSVYRQTEWGCTARIERMGPFFYQ
jgi:hypothetical protein